MGGRRSGPGLVGRTDELLALRAALDDALAGEPGCVLVEGPAGIGKSRLVAELVRAARDRDVVVLVGHASGFAGGSLPYAPLVEALLSRPAPEPGWTSAVEELLTAAAGAPAPPGGGAQTRLLAGVTQLLLDLARERPVLLLVEDLHWADRSTLLFLGRFAAALREARLLLVLTTRVDGVAQEVTAWLHEQRRDPRVREVVLAGLAPVELGALLAGLAGAPVPPDVLADVARRSGGNPFFAAELWQAWASGHGAGLPATLREALSVQLRHLSAPARTALELVATSGGTLGHDVLVRAGQALDVGEDALLDGLQECSAAGLLAVGEDGTYALRHALLAEGALAELLPVQLRRRHALLADVLTAGRSPQEVDDPGNASAVSLHRAAAGDGPAAFSWSLRAARLAAGVHAYPEAARHAERALALWDDVPGAVAASGADRTAVLQETAELRASAGDVPAALAHLRRALALVDPDAEPVRAALLQERLCWHQVVWGSVEDGLAAGREAVRLVGAAPPSAEHARVLGGHGRALALSGRMAEARGPLTAGLAMAREVGADGELARILSLLGSAAAACGDEQEGLAVLEEACRLAVEHGDADALGPSYNNLACVLAQLCRTEEALEVALRGWALAREAGLERATGYLLSGAASGALALGRPEQADELVTELERLGDPDVALARAELDLRRGRLPEAERALGAFPAQGRRVQAGSWRQVLLAELRLWQGRPDEAVRLAREALPDVLETDDDVVAAGALLWCACRGCADLAQRGRDLQDGRQVDAALRELDRLDEVAAHVPLEPQDAPDVWRRAYALLRDAELGRLHRAADAAERWHRAVVRCGECHLAYEQVYARWRQAEALLLADAGSATGAAVLREVAGSARRLDAAAVLAEAEALARRTRVELAGPPAGPVLDDGAGERLGLTDRELDVLRLVAAGRSNREIGRALYVTPKTVSTHVSNILRKLDVPDRTQAAAVAHRFALDEPD